MRPFSRLRSRWFDIAPPPVDSPPPPLKQRLLWLVAIWIASVSVLSLVAMSIRLVLK